MKATKLLALLLALLMVVAVFVACGGGDETESQTETESETETETETESDTTYDDKLEGVSFKDNRNPNISLLAQNWYVQEVAQMELSPEDNPNIVRDAQYWAHLTVEDRLGVKVTATGLPCAAGATGGRTEWQHLVRDTVSLKTYEYDGTDGPANAQGILISEGVFYDLNKVETISFEKPWWNQSMQSAGTIYGQLFLALGSASESSTALTSVIYMNKSLYEKYHADKKDIYQVVRDGEWTIDYLYDLTEGVHADLDNSGGLSKGDEIGITGQANNSAGGMDAWLYALGLTISTIDADGEPEVTIDTNEKAILAFNKLKKLHVENPGAFVLTAQTHPTASYNEYKTGKVMFMLHLMNQNNTWRNSVPDSRLGILPLPKYDKEQDAYHTSLSATATVMSILSSIEEDRVDMVGAVLELTAAEGLRQVAPAYIENVLKAQAAEAPDDTEMIEIIMGSYVYELPVLHQLKCNLFNIYRDPSNDFTKLMGERAPVYETYLDTFLTAVAGLTAAE